MEAEEEALRKLRAFAEEHDVPVKRVYGLAMEELADEISHEDGLAERLLNQE